jgi:high-affinity nickel permease
VIAEPSVLATLGLGFLLGVRHALDADHVAAVSAFVSEHGSVRRACLLGTVWGLGHTAALLAAGVAAIAFRLAVPPEAEHWLELAVALTLVLLGGHVLRALGGVVVHRHEHEHDGVMHRHAHLHAGGVTTHRHRPFFGVGPRPFVMGVLHGLAGSAALTVLVVASIPSALGGVVYITVFGLGSTGGMLVLSGLIGVPFALAAGRSAAAHGLVQGLAGAASLALGAALAWRLGVG